MIFAGGEHMLEINSKLDVTADIDKGDLRKLDGKLLVDIQGELEITFNNRRFFCEPSLALLEFATVLKRWDGKESLHYFTIEHDESEGAILAFLHKGADEWELQSIWQEFQITESISGEVIRDTVKHFLKDFNNQMERHYNFTVERFLKGK